MGIYISPEIFLKLISQEINNSHHYQLLTNFDFGVRSGLNSLMTTLTVLLAAASLRWIPVTMTHARRSDPGAEKLSAKRSNVYDLSNHFWQRKFRHRAALYLKSLFDRIWNRLELKLNPKLGQGYPNLFEHSQNLNLGFFGFRYYAHLSSSRVKYGPACGQIRSKICIRSYSQQNHYHA